MVSFSLHKLFYPTCAYSIARYRWLSIGISGATQGRPMELYYGQSRYNPVFKHQFVRLDMIDVFGLKSKNATYFLTGN
jgi:hypothetical protein